MTALLVSNDDDNPETNGKKIPDEISNAVPYGGDPNSFLTNIEDYFPEQYRNAILKDYCPKSNDEKEISFCVTDSEDDEIQCEDLRDALTTKYAMPHIKCERQSNFETCLNQVGQGGPDYAIMEAGWAYQGGRWQNTRPVMYERYDDNNDYFYSVAVVKKNRGGNFKFHNLRSKYS